MWDMTHSYVWHDSFICVTWLIHMFNRTHSYVWHDSFICVTWLIHMCDMTPLKLNLLKMLNMLNMLNLPHLLCGTWLIHMCDMTHSLVRHNMLKMLNMLNMLNLRLAGPETQNRGRGNSCLSSILGIINPIRDSHTHTSSPSSPPPPPWTHIQTKLQPTSSLRQAGSETKNIFGLRSGKKYTQFVTHKWCCYPSPTTLHPSPFSILASGKKYTSSWLTSDAATHHSEWGSWAST